MKDPQCLNGFSCPIDATPLKLIGQSLVCENRHTFDVAKSGYVNLLPVQKKRSKDPGDSKEMVSARRSFLDLHYYLPVVHHILSSSPDNLFQSGKRILDAGCGEGYYLEQLGKNLTQQNIEMERVGLDISKWAIAAASKRDKNIKWVVGSNASLPVPDERFDLVMCLFGFPVFSEFYRVLSPSGWVLLIESGPMHLIEMRKILYPSIHSYKQTYMEGVEGFSLKKEETLEYDFTLNSQNEIQQLLSMTPHIHKAPYEGRHAVKQLNSLKLTADIRFRWYQKKT